MLALDVLPDVELGPVGNREHAEMFAGCQTGVEQRPEFGALVLGLPLTERIAVREYAFFRTCLFLVTACAADECVEAEFLDRFEQRHRLVRVARLARMRQAHGAARHRVFDAAHDEFGTQFLCAQITEVGHFGEVVAGVDHQQRVRNASRAESLLGALQQHQRILAAGEQEGGALERASDFAQDEDRFFFERVELGIG